MVADGAGDGANLGDLITYTISIENKGNVTLNSFNYSDTIKDGNELFLSLDGLFCLSAAAVLYTRQVGGTATFALNYTIDQQAVDNVEDENSAVGTAGGPSGVQTGNDTSDDGDDSDGILDDDPICFLLTATDLLSASTSPATVNDPDGNGVDLGDSVPIL